MSLDVTTINFAVYRDTTRYVGIASVTLPDVTALTATVTGAGIGGNVEFPIIGQLEAMTLTMNFHNVTAESIKLSQPEVHTITLRVARQDVNQSDYSISVESVKHILKIMPKSDKAGTLAPATEGGGSGEYSVFYWATYLDGTLVRKIDQLNGIYTVNSNTYTGEVSSILGLT